jgi:hypothetical protein
MRRLGIVAVGLALVVSSVVGGIGDSRFGGIWLSGLARKRGTPTSAGWASV